MTRRGTYPHHPLRLRLRNDRGIALPMVLMVFIVGVALISAFLVAIVGSSQVTATNKNIVQAQAAAEAGIAAVEAKMRTTSVNPCSTNLSALAETTSNWSYSLSWVGNCPTVEGTQSFVSLRSEGISGDAVSTVEAKFTWLPGTPEPEATGDNIFYFGGGGTIGFQNNSIALGDPLGTRPTVTASRASEFNCSGITFPGGLLVAGNLSGTCTVNGDVHIGGSLNGTLNNVEGGVKVAGTGSLKLSGTVSGTVEANGEVSTTRSVGGGIVTTGKVVLDTNATVGTSETPANVVAGGGVELKDSRVKVYGDVTAGGDVSVTGTIYGDLVAGGNVTIKKDGHVMGNITSRGTVTIESNGRVGIIRSATDRLDGTVTALGVVTLRNGVEVPGRIISGGAVSLDGNWVGRYLAATCKVEAREAVTWNNPPSGLDVTASKCVAPAGTPAIPVITAVASVPAPTIPQWQEYNNTPAEIAKWGFETAPEGDWSCTNWSTSGNGNNPVPNAWSDLEDLESASIFNLTDCAISVKSKGTVTLSRDVAIIAKSFDLDSLTFVAAPNTKPRIWLIQKGSSSSGAPVCVGTDPAISLKQTEFSSPIVTMLYTPCKVDFSNKVVLTGNIYASGISITGSAQHTSVAFSPIDILSWNTTTDENGNPIGTGTPSLGALLVQRNVD
ncbi:hypothetical protein [Leucobacter sp. W1478]|uniref:bactofilin family protein n=1 Tax=Leucobacter sp. W1478 TaxID=3439065 RepID=UPI003F3797D2